MFAGTPATVLERLTPLIEATKADELMVTTMIYDHAARRHSYELLAERSADGRSFPRALSRKFAACVSKEPRTMPGFP